MSDTGAAKLPGIPVLRTDDRALATWAQAVTEHLEVRNGSRGNPMEKVVLERDMSSITKVVEGLTKPKTAASTDISIDIGGGVTVNIPVDTLVDKLLASQKFKTATGATTTTTDPASVDYGSSAVSRVEAVLGARIDALQGRSTSSLGDNAFYLSGPTGPITGTFINPGPTFGGGADPVKVFKHPNATALKSDVVIYNDFTIKELMTDLYNMIYEGGGPTGKPVKLNKASVLWDGQTIQDWAIYMYNTRVLAERACIAAGVSSVP